MASADFKFVDKNDIALSNVMVFTDNILRGTSDTTGLAHCKTGDWLDITKTCIFKKDGYWEKSGAYKFKGILQEGHYKVVLARKDDADDEYSGLGWFSNRLGEWFKVGIQYFIMIIIFIVILLILYMLYKKYS